MTGRHARASHRDLLRSLHVPGRPLVLPNAWDAASAREVVAAGFPVVATTSAGVAEALGYEDHQGAPAEEMFAAAARIARAVDVPVTVDSEAGYGLEPEMLVASLESAGAAGCNLEDTDHATGRLRDSAEQAEWLEAVRGSDGSLVVNARVDVFLSGSGELDEAVERARAYFAAGADCVYPITLADRDRIAAFVERAGGPVNILASADAPAIPVLAELGVARVSFGSALFRSGIARLAETLRGLGSVGV